jgi:hypothetical protein
MRLVLTKIGTQKENLMVYSSKKISKSGQVKKRFSQDEMDLAIAEKRLKSAKFSGQKEIDSYLRKRGIK